MSLPKMPTLSPCTLSMASASHNGLQGNRLFSLPTPTPAQDRLVLSWGVYSVDLGILFQSVLQPSSSVSLPLHDFYIWGKSTFSRARVLQLQAPLQSHYPRAWSVCRRTSSILFTISCFPVTSHSQWQLGVNGTKPQVSRNEKEKIS